MTRRALRAAEDERPLSIPLAFDEFFAVERDRLFGALWLITGNRDDAEEIAQDAFVRVWERWDRVQAMENPAGYLHRVARNDVRRRLRRASALRRLTPRLLERSPTPEIEIPVVLHEALRSLSPRQRAALVLTEFWGYSAEEAGSALGVKPSTIGALKHQGRAAVQHGRRDDD